MIYDTREIDPQTAYKLIVSTVTPRPIAWVTTQAADGTLNAAPYSFFNAMGNDPPTVVLGLIHDPDRGVKDTAQNIVDTGEFVVNLVSVDLAEQMNATSVNAPAKVDELALAGIETAPSVRVAPPRIAGSPVQFECSLFSAVVTSPHQVIAIGRIEVIHVADNCLIDAGRAYVDNEKLDLIARLHGRGWYVHGGERFELTRPVYGKS